MPPRLNRSSARRSLKDAPPSSYRRTLVYRWLDAAQIAQDRVGDVMSLMRARKDMPRSFPTKGHMWRYLKRCGVGDEAAEHVFERLWALYRYWLDQIRNDTELTS